MSWHVGPLEELPGDTRGGQWDRGSTFRGERGVPVEEEVGPPRVFFFITKCNETN